MHFNTRTFRGHQLSKPHPNSGTACARSTVVYQQKPSSPTVLQEKYRPAFRCAHCLSPKLLSVYDDALPRKERMKSPNSLENETNHKFKGNQFNFFYFDLSKFNILVTCETVGFQQFSPNRRACTLTSCSKGGSNLLNTEALTGTQKDVVILITPFCCARHKNLLRISIGNLKQVPGKMS